MKAVYEEVNGNFAVFIVDDIKKAIHIPVSKLPEDARLGDVFEIYLKNGEMKLIKNLPEERDARLKSNQAKREELLKRKKDLP